MHTAVTNKRIKICKLQLAILYMYIYVCVIFVSESNGKHEIFSLKLEASSNIVFLNRQ